MKMLGLSCAIFPTLLIATTAIAANKATKVKEPVPFAVQVAPITHEFMTAEEFHKKLKAIADRAKRSVATTDRVTDEALSVKLRNLRNELIGNLPRLGPDGQETGVYPGIKTSAELYKFYSDLDNDAIYQDPKNPPDYKFVAAQLAFLKTFKGFYNRCKDLFRQANLTHGATVTGLRAMASGVMTYLPDAQWAAGLQYLAYPAPELPTIDRISAFHTFIDKELIPAQVKLGNRIAALNFSERPVYFDNRILYGSASFSNDRDQYIRIAEPERQAVLANIYAATSASLSLTSYWLGGIFDAADEIGKKYGIGQTFNPDGASASQRFKILRKYAGFECSDKIKKQLKERAKHDTSTIDDTQHVFQSALGKDENCQLFTLREKGEESMRDAYKYLGDAVAASRLAWDELGKRSQSNSTGPDGQPDTRNIFDPRLFAPFDRVANANLTGLEYLVEKKAGKLTSAVVSTEDLDVNLKRFFLGEGAPNHLPPVDLTVFFPTHFNEEAYEKTATINGKSYKWHDFRNGSPDAWKYEEFSNYIKTSKNEADVRKLARISGQAWGGWLVGIPLGSLMF